jgi:ferredoxin
MNDTYPSEIVAHPRPVDAALAFLNASPVRAAAKVHYSSIGRLLVIGRPEAMAAVAGLLPGNLEISMAVGGECPPELAARLAASRIRLRDSLSGIDVFGWLGSFKYTATARGERGEVESGAEFCEGGFDLVLDLLEPRIARRPCPPIGYVAAAGNDPQALREVLAQLPQWVGEFDKPNYLLFDRNVCAHRGSSGIETCAACYDACGTWAITKEEVGIAFNPYLCQGCGDCATACPTSAIAYNFPATAYVLARIERMIQIYQEHGGKVPVLLLHDNSSGMLWLEQGRDRLPINLLPYGTESLGASSAEIWLMALALGAAEVLLLDSGGTNSRTRALLDFQIEWCRAILGGLGFEPEALRLVDAAGMELAALPVHARRTLEPLAAWTEDGDKRTLIREAVAHLGRQASPPPSVPLPTGAPFGSVEVDADACVRCMDCVRACPTAALRGDAEGGRLWFVEAACIQCGGCVESCQEGAVSLRPRYLYDSQAAATAQILASRKTATFP